MSGERIRAITFTYEANDGDAELMAVVLGTVAENLRGITIHEIVDDTLFQDREDHGALDALYEAMTADGRLTDDMRAQLAEFEEAVRAWTGGEQ